MADSTPPPAPNLSNPPAPSAGGPAAGSTASPPGAPNSAAATAPRSDELLTPQTMRQLDQLSMASKRLFIGRMKGERRSPRRGQSVEFADYRNYVLGDDLRFIDWNVYARLDRLFLKLFMEEEDLNVAIILDTSASMAYGEPDKLLFAKRVAAALGYIALRNQDRLSIYTATERLDLGPSALRGRNSAYRLIEFLRSQTGAGRTNLRAACREFSLRHKGSGVVIVISDFLDKRGYEEALRFLMMRRSDVVAIHVLAPDEAEPNLSEDLQLVDLEDGAIVEVSKSDVVLAHYKRTLKTFCEGLKDACVRRDMVYCYALSDQPFDELVLKTLRRYGVLD